MKGESDSGFSRCCWRAAICGMLNTIAIREAICTVYSKQREQYFLVPSFRMNARSSRAISTCLTTANKLRLRPCIFLVGPPKLNNDLTTVVQIMQKSNVAIPASNVDAVLLDSVSHWCQFGYFSRYSLWEIISRVSTMYGYASRNWLYPSRFSTQWVTHTLKITFCCLE